MEAEQHTHDAEVLDGTRRDGGVGLAQHQPHRVGLDEKNHAPRHDAVEQLYHAAVLDTLPDAVGAAGAVVLPHIGSHSHAHALHGQGEHLTDLFAGGLGCHSGAAQQVDGVLHDDRADGRDGILKPHGKADVGQPLAVPCRKQGARLPEGKPLQLCRAGKEPVDAQSAAEQLAEHGGDGSTVHPHAQRHDEEVVQQNVHHAGDQQEIKWVPGIAQCPQHAGGVVIQHRSRDAQKNEPDVEHRIGVQLLRRMDEPEQRPCHQGGKHGEHHAQYQTEQCAVQQVFLQSVLILCAKGLCRRDAKAHAGTLHKAQNEKVEGVGGAHRAQRIGAQTPPYDDGVRKAVQLLE